MMHLRWSSGFKGSGVQVSVIIGIIVVRYILLPVLGAVIVKSAVHFGLVHSDPLYQFVLLLQFALPPAMNIGQSIVTSGSSSFRSYSTLIVSCQSLEILC